MSVFMPCLNPATLTGLPLPGFLHLAADAGFTAVELPIQQVLTIGPRHVRALLSELGLYAATASGILPAGPVLPAPLLIDGDAYEHAVAGLDERLCAFQAIGCPTATIVLNPRTTMEPGRAAELVITRLRDLGNAAGQYGVRLAVEAVGVTSGLDPCLDGPHQVARALPDLAAVLAEADNPYLAVCLDSFHWAATGSAPDHLADVAGLIAHVQIADIPHQTAPEELTDAARMFPGDGGLDWGGFGEGLAGYTGAVSVELFNPELRRLPETQIAQRAFQAATRVFHR